MSWGAQRYQRENHDEYRPRSKRPHPISSKSTMHHVPPKSKGAEFILQKEWNRHSAYHLIFGNAASYEECCRILQKDWWTPQ